MKKKIFAITLALAALVAMPSIAKTPKAEKQNTEQTECKDACKKDKKCDDKCTGKVEGRKCDKKSDGKCEGKKCDKKNGEAKKCDGRKDEGCKHEGKKFEEKSGMRHCKAEGPNGLKAALKGIDLTDAQKEQIKALRQECREEMEKNMENVCNEMRGEMDAKLAEILTPEQMDQYRTNRVKIDARRDCSKVEECRERKHGPKMECATKCETPASECVKK